ncbi:MAG: 5-(carboxyamino)imidazole ribonucleotide synthase [Hyphomicrobium sp.]
MTKGLPPGSTIGILGGGQLGRMLALSAAQLGFKTHIYAPEADSPAFDVSSANTVAAYDDEATLNAFAKSVSVATYEFENIPVATVAYLSKLIPVRPGAKALACAQDRINEKTLARELGAMTAPFAAVDSLADLRAALATIGAPAVLKTRRFGYDGKGQAKILTPIDADAAWAAMRDQPSILEGFVNFQSEVSVIAARGLDGAFRAFDVTENEHRHHILHRSIAPARISAAARDAAIETARRIAAELDYVGVFAIEFFALRSAEDEILFVNEMAPRVHNSGHWTMDGAVASQFEQHIRAVAGWPLASTAMTAPGAEMINLIGDDIHAWDQIAAEPGTVLHHYGKKDARPGRKMGHVNRRLAKAP